MTNRRIAIALPFVLLALALRFLSGCADVQLRIADALAVEVVAIERPLHAAETAEGLRAIQHVLDAGGTRADADAATAAIEARWAPVWAAIDVAVASIRTWVAAIKAAGDASWSELLRAACGVVKAAAPLAPADVRGVLETAEQLGGCAGPEAPKP